MKHSFKILFFALFSTLLSVSGYAQSGAPEATDYSAAIEAGDAATLKAAIISALAAKGKSASNYADLMVEIRAIMSQAMTGLSDAEKETMIGELAKILTQVAIEILKEENPGMSTAQAAAIAIRAVKPASEDVAGENGLNGGRVSVAVKAGISTAVANIVAGTGESLTLVVEQINNFTDNFDAINSDLIIEVVTTDSTIDVASNEGF